MKFKKSIITLAVTLLLAALMASVAQAEVRDLWGVDPSGQQQLVNLNPWTGAEVTRFALPAISSTDTAIGLAGWQDELFYINGSSNLGNVYMIDPATGATLNQYSISGSWNVNGLGYYSGAEGSYLYTSGCSVGDMHRYVAADGSEPTFYWSTINNSNAVGGDYGGRIFTPVTDTQTIAEVDPLINTNPINTIPAPSGSIVGMAYDGEWLYASDVDGYLYILNPDTGAVMNTIQLPYTLYALGSTEGTGGNPVPEPATLLLLGGGLAGLAGLKRRRG